MEFVGSRIEEYFKTNTNETTASIRYDFQAYLRGQMIWYTCAIINKELIKKTNFYHSYKAESSGISSHQTTFLDGLQIPSLSDEAKQHLESQFSIEELLKAITLMKSGKTAGTDGLPIDIFKAFKEKMVYPLMNMYKESLELGILPPSLRITLIPKPDKPHTKYESYRPVFLINTEAKILAKMLDQD